jgi:hypothetical protein
MISHEQCEIFAGLAASEMILGAPVSSRHDSLLSSYLLNLKRGPEALRELIVSDIRASLDIGAEKLAADLLIVLRSFLSKHPEARLVPPMTERSANSDHGQAYNA